VRTERNVKDSDGTLILTVGPVRGGTARTVKAAEKVKKPYLVIDLSETRGPEVVRGWLQINKIKTLNVAGPRESEAPGIQARAVEFLRQLFHNVSLHVV
jgi:hypothetical protein